MQKRRTIVRRALIAPTALLHPTWSLLSAEANTNPLLERWQEERPVLGEFYTDRLDTYRWDAGRGRLVLHVPDAPELRG